MLRCVVTGADGFVGRALVPHLSNLGHEPLAWRRSDNSFVIPADNPAFEQALGNWTARLHGVDVVIHLAGIAHQIGAAAAQAESLYFQINAQGSELIARASALAGVKRFIYLSTAKVFGEGGELYGPDTALQPMDLYAQSKWAAEQRVRKQGLDFDMDVVVIRPPLIYGAEAKGNFAKLQRLAASPLPLPIASLNNRRDMIALPNLLELIETCLSHPAAAGGVWLCADAQPYTLAEIISALRVIRGRSPAVFRGHENSVKWLINQLIGREAANKLLGDFRVDCSATVRTLGWSPKYLMSQALISNVVP